MKYLFLFLFSIFLGFLAGKEEYGKMDILYLRTQKEVREKIRRDQTNRLLLDQPARTEDIVAEITRVFGGEGKVVLRQALEISWCESKWSEKAFHINKDKSTDGGVFQINSVHRLSEEERFDFKSNIQKAYEIYKAWKGWDAWACARYL